MALWLPKVRQTGRDRICLVNTHRRRYPTILSTTCEGYVNTLYLTSIYLYIIQKGSFKKEKNKAAESL